ncbi:MAG TPA: hypothetical protein VEB21_11800 [Terriglobales bacterium]|nr:hypothetical protein [Terriglobales bacterium]
MKFGAPRLPYALPKVVRTPPARARFSAAPTSGSTGTAALLSALLAALLSTLLLTGLLRAAAAALRALAGLALLLLWHAFTSFRFGHSLCET